jgi:hypothetical protein
VQRKKWGWPSPGLVIAVVALIAAFSGAALAGPAHKLLTKRKVVQIADQEIASKASGLSVKHATSADSATDAAHAQSAQTAQDLPDLQFTNLTLQNNWAPYPAVTRPPAYAIDAQGVVHLRGAMTRNSGSSLNPIQVPPALRPAAWVYLVADFAGGDTGRLLIATDGQAFVEGSNTANATNFTSLEGLTYVP